MAEMIVERIYALEWKENTCTSALYPGMGFMISFILCEWVKNNDVLYVRKRKETSISSLLCKNGLLGMNRKSA